MARVDPFSNVEHNHHDCVDSAMSAAEQICREKGLRLTDTRRRVLQLVWQSHQPIGAYELLEALVAEGRSAAPPTVYRSLEFLMQAGLVHRLDSLNAFIGCADPTHPHTGQFLICRECRSVAELDEQAISELVSELASGIGFTAVRQMLEIEGVCSNCQD